MEVDVGPGLPPPAKLQSSESPKLTPIDKNGDNIPSKSICITTTETQSSDPGLVAGPESSTDQDADLTPEEISNLQWPEETKPCVLELLNAISTYAEKCAWRNMQIRREIDGKLLGDVLSGLDRLPNLHHTSPDLGDIYLGATAGLDFKVARDNLRRAFEHDMEFLLMKEQARQAKLEQEEKRKREKEETENEEREKESHSTQNKESATKKKTSDDTQKDAEDQATNSDPETGNKKQPKTPRIKIQPVQWDEFISYKKSISEYPIIQILIGDPVLSFGRSNMQKVHKTYTGQEELPERIRLNSEFLMGLLSTFEPMDLYEGLIVVRPYEILIRRNNHIRQTYRKIERRFRISSDNDDPTDDINDWTDDDDDDDDNDYDDHESFDLQTVQRRLKKTIANASEENLQELDALIQFMNEYIDKRYQRIHSFPPCSVYFSDLPLLFKSLEFIVSAEQTQVYQTVSLVVSRHRQLSWRHMFDTEKGNKREAVIECVSIGFNGHSLGPVKSTFSIPEFSGTKEVKSFPVRPAINHAMLDFLDRLPASQLAGAEPPSNTKVADHYNEFKKTLIDRGRTFLECLAPRHMFYAGVNLVTGEEIESPVIVDAKEAFSGEGRQSWKPNVSHVLKSTLQDNEQSTCDGFCCEIEVYIGSNSDQAWNDYVDSTLKKQSRTVGSFDFPLNILEYPASTVLESKDRVCDDCLFIMSISTHGFVLKDRAWATFDVSRLEHLSKADGKSQGHSNYGIVDANSMSRNLVIPESHQKNILALVSQHTRNKDADNSAQQYDIVRGKGKGLIILLHGAPGVGKTTTAGDLGSTATEVEAALKQNFDLASKWDCLLLLDEADVFLAARRRDDFARNALVAVFLRTLEYFSGILFLTTNRIGDFDEAFKSRIHLSLYYQPLTLEYTKRIFEINFSLMDKRYYGRDEKFKIDRHDINGFVEHYWNDNEEARWNGRQIRNVCQSALALAEYDAFQEAKDEGLDRSDILVHLKFEYFESIAKTYTEFSEYLYELHGANEELFAYQKRIRAYKPKNRVNGTGNEGSIAARNLNQHSISSSSKVWAQKEAPVQDKRTAHQTETVSKTSAHHNQRSATTYTSKIPKINQPVTLDYDSDTQGGTNSSSYAASNSSRRTTQDHDEDYDSTPEHGRSRSGKTFKSKTKNDDRLHPSLSRSHINASRKDHSRTRQGSFSHAPSEHGSTATTMQENSPARISSSSLEPSQSVHSQNSTPGSGKSKSLLRRFIGRK